MQLREKGQGTDQREGQGEEGGKIHRDPGVAEGKPEHCDNLLW